MTLPALIFKYGGWCPALNRSYRPGFYQPETREEYNALAQYAENAEPLPDESKPVVVVPTKFAEDFNKISDLATADIDELKAYAATLPDFERFAHNISAEKLRSKIAEYLAKG